ncbi:MAG: peroxiredoxin [Acidimicrobiales bacterium]|jgi:peroxiredoxin
MPLNLQVGDIFPDVTLTNDRGQAISIGEVAQGQPLFLAFFRGPW